LSKPRKSRSEWCLTEEAFDKLLAAFSPDRDEAAKQYEALRTKLVRSFEWREVPLADACADETLNRVARRIDEGKQIDKVVAYAYRVAYLVFLETLTEPEFVDIDQEGIHPPAVEPQFEDAEREQRQRCFEGCLQELPIKNREIILVYYEGERRMKIERRKKLAEELKISLDALRIRAHRIRKGLEECISRCLQQPEPMRNVTG
jgi:DNA-directed RNA polymerase specialized sigma24 family protein